MRAKTKILDAGIRFEVPQEHEWLPRLDAVLEAIYAAFGIGWDDMVGADQRGRELAEEAIWLARVLLQLMPREAEVRGLLALMLHCEARRPARRGPDGRYVPLSEQDSRQWCLPLIEEAEHHLAEAVGRGCTGRFQLEAAIQSVHSERARSGRTEWAAIMLFYEQLIRISPTLSTRTGYAATVAEAKGPAEGLAVLDRIDLDAVSGYQPYWAVRAHTLQQLGKTSESLHAYDKAIGFAEDPAIYFDRLAGGKATEFRILNPKICFDQLHRCQKAEDGCVSAVQGGGATVLCASRSFICQKTGADGSCRRHTEPA